MIEVMMTRPDLEAEAPALPEGVRFVDFRDGDEALWHDLQQRSGAYGDLATGLFVSQFGDPAEAPIERIFFAYHGERPIGTAAAWLPQPDAPAGAGRVHWVAVVSGEQGRGVGTALVLEALRRFRELGHTSAFLTTGNENTGAIRLYRRLGFVAAPRNEEERRAWQGLSVSTDDFSIGRIDVPSDS